MRKVIPIFVLGAWLASTPWLSSHGQPRVSSPQALPPPPPGSPQGNTEDLLPLKLKMEQIVQEMKASARVMETLATASSEGLRQLALQTNVSLNSFDPEKTIRDFLNSPPSIQWEECMKTGKFSLSLFSRLFEMGKTSPPNLTASPTASPGREVISKALQLSLFSRLLAEYQLRYAEILNTMASKLDSGQKKRWQQLREALAKSDGAFREKMKTFLDQTGWTPLQLAAEIGIASSNRGHPSPIVLIEALQVFDPSGAIWEPSELSGLAAPPAPSPLSSGPASPTQNTSGLTKQEPPALRLPSDKVLWEEAPIEKIDLPPRLGAQAPPAASPTTPHGTTLVSRPPQKIPTGWIRCECPDDHPKAGMVIDGVRWHPPVLVCPNPDPKRWEVK